MPRGPAPKQRKKCDVVFPVKISFTSSHAPVSVGSMSNQRILAPPGSVANHEDAEDHYFLEHQSADPTFRTVFSCRDIADAARAFHHSAEHADLSGLPPAQAWALLREFSVLERTPDRWALTRESRARATGQ